jgi:Protein of unknown function (DUF2877)
MQWQSISVTTLGKLSRSLLVCSTQAVVIGAISGGVFIKFNPDLILFLTYESFHGPLTLNLSGAKTALKSVEVNDRIVIQGEKILIPSSGIEINFSHAETWGAPPPPDILQSASDRIGLLKTVSGHILSLSREPGLYLALKDMLDIELERLPSLPKGFEQIDYIRLVQLLKTKNIDEIFSALTPFLGLGAGLTPSGDDLILGLLLAYHRSRTGLKTSFDLAELNALLNQAASQKTTLLSVNLIACASQGQADERLISALDGILTGNRPPEQCARDLMSWGNSSGRDALVGMALAILSASG